MSKLSEFTTPWGHDVATVLLRRRVDSRFEAYLAERHRGEPGAGDRLLRDLTQISREAMGAPANRDALAAFIGYMFMVACMQDWGVNQLVPGFNKLVPAATVGAAFMTGRKRQAVSPISKWVGLHMKSNPRAKAVDVWRAFEKKPAKGYTPCENRAFGRYIEDSHGKTVMGWRRFQNLVSKHRPSA